MFGEEIILLWNGMLLKKRIVVVSEKLSLLLKTIRSFPLFVWHRQPFDILRPYVLMNESELKDLKSFGVYCAGFVEQEAKQSDELYDLLVDLDNRSMTINPNSTDSFIMTSLHKDICSFILQTAENGSDQDLIKGLTLKTNQLLSKLEQCKQQHPDGLYVDMKTLENAKLPANVDRFLYHLAIAEGQTKI